MRTAAGMMLVAVALTACSTGTDAPAEDPDRAGDTTCQLVRAGIDAFNTGDVDGTIELFREALEPARDYADLSDDPVADDLLEAVQYYADLPADEYVEAFRTSEEFRRYQAITLGQCETAPVDDAVPT
ncbi:hypothetical protein HMPREF0063_10839 [Aeromicrobium marinum DSM 15272]|uniref:Lipoprotein n=1 Tax=Aeromicrobium marinum DSM 15272 TaxID=585531 RepID=E2SA49_9ACTN|nr:hypothetical protein [Aeromicrobium marinum]EFQ84123.1 hypothetical protein HMPREF0063_10839 [Aeromicrobium marinum DSM 15272]